MIFSTHKSTNKKLPFLSQMRSVQKICILYYKKDTSQWLPKVMCLIYLLSLFNKIII